MSNLVDKEYFRLRTLDFWEDVKAWFPPGASATMPELFWDLEGPNIVLQWRCESAMEASKIQDALDDLKPRIRQAGQKWRDLREIGIKGWEMRHELLWTLEPRMVRAELYNTW